MSEPTVHPCVECGHTARMHVRGVSPRYAGCMVRIGERTPNRRAVVCPCRLTPEQARARAAASG